jgi:hypothetical protein
MILNQILRFIADEFSAGGFFQNVGFYTVAVLFVWIITAQFKEKSSRYRVN